MAEYVVRTCELEKEKALSILQDARAVLAENREIKFALEDSTAAVGSLQEQLQVGW